MVEASNSVWRRRVCWLLVLASVLRDARAQPGAPEPTCEDWCSYPCTELNGNTEIECGACDEELACHPGMPGFDSAALNAKRAAEIAAMGGTQGDPQDNYESGPNTYVSSTSCLADGTGCGGDAGGGKVQTALKTGEVISSTSNCPRDLTAAEFGRSEWLLPTLFDEGAESCQDVFDKGLCSMGAAKKACPRRCKAHCI